MSYKLAAGFLMMPIVQHVLVVAPIPDGVTPERYQRGIAIGTMIQKAAIFLAPVGAAIIFVYSSRDLAWRQFRIFRWGEIS